MEVEIYLPAKTSPKLVKVIESEFPDIYEDGDREHNDLSYFVGQSSDDTLTDDAGKETEWLTYDEAIECCGFVEGAVPGAETLIEGSGGWAQGMISRRDFSSLAVSDKAKRDWKRISNRYWKAFRRGQLAAKWRKRK